jgi:hypothetical protein
MLWQVSECVPIALFAVSHVSQCKAWNVKEGKRYICIGTWGYSERPGIPLQGRVLVFSLKFDTKMRSSGRVSV